jgi:D-alanyl-D-alanine dipeptidase
MAKKPSKPCYCLSLSELFGGGLLRSGLLGLSGLFRSSSTFASLASLTSLASLSSLACLLLSCNAYALPRNFVYLKDIDPSIIQELRYSGYHNFIGRPIEGYKANTCILTKQAAKALSQVQKELKKKSFSLKVYDCYRPTRAVADFITWSKNPKQQEMKQEFYPHVDKAHVFHLGYVAERSGHSRGSTLDLTIVPIPSPKQASYIKSQPLVSCIAAYDQRFADNSIDMGSGFDCMDKASHYDNANLNSRAQKNRKMLREVMMRYGFQPYPLEWWHFTFEPETYPNSYFDFEVR